MSKEMCLIPDRGRKIPISPQKAQSISKDVPHLVGGYRFWTYIPAMDQPSDEARVEVVGQILETYRKARFMVVIREEDGICSGCLDCLNSVHEWEGSSGTTNCVTLLHGAANNLMALDKHVQRCHPNGLCELWMERNCPLQGILLSSKVQFAVCKELPELVVTTRSG